jgi:hypothetical protein
MDNDGYSNYRTASHLTGITMRCVCRLTVLVWLTYSGCQSPLPDNHSGNLAAFILDEVAGYGARIKTRKPPVPIEARWTYEPAKNMAMIQVQGNHFNEVEALLLSVFGPPRTAVHQRSDGYRGGGYWIGDIGVAITFSENAGGCTIALINPRY